MPDNRSRVSRGRLLRVKSAALPFGIGLLSASVILTELLLTRLFSVSLYYHFAFLAVSVAMLGLGAGGLLVYLNRRRLPREALPGALVLLGLAMAVLIVVALAITLQVRVPNAVSLRMAAYLAFLFVLASLPFLCAGASVSLLNWHFAERIHRIYFYDLTGAALGGLLVLPALDRLGAPNAVLLAAVLAGLSACLLGWATGAARSRLVVGSLATLALAFLLATNLAGDLLDLRYAKGASTGGEIYARWNAISRVCVHPGGDAYWIRIDCDAATVVPRIDFDRADRASLRKQFSRTGEDLAHVLRPSARTLVIGSGGGMDVARALAHGSEHVVAVEINPLIARDLMLGFLREDSRRLFERPEVELIVDDARSAIQRSPERFDVMQSSLIDTWASTAAGAFALSESYLYTVEAFAQYLNHLSPDGILIITRWEFVPPRQALRVVSVGRAAMEKIGILHPASHFVVMQDGRRNVSKVSVLMKRSPFTAAELQQVDAFLAANPAVHSRYMPGRSEENAFFALLHAPDLGIFAAQYPFDITPTDDAHPFFFFTTRWNRFADILRGSREDLKNNLALFNLAVLSLVVVGSVAALLLVPRWFSVAHSGESGFKARWLYFLAIGVAYIVIEISLIQTFILFLGHPIYGITIVVFALLVGSGLGSRWSGRLESPARATWVVPVVLAAVFFVLHLLLLPEIFALAQRFTREVRGLLSVALLIPLGFLMGIPYPCGVRSLATSEREALPWFWSANAGGSVLGSVLVVILAIAIGIPGAGMAAAGGYLFAAFAALYCLRLHERESAVHPVNSAD